MDDRQFARLLDFMGYSWSGYRRVRQGAKKRVARHMAELGCRSMRAYLELLETSPGTLAECERRMTVTISRFFRDLQVWRLLGERVLPDLAAQGLGRIRAWFAGCACGEEVYSFRILLRELDNAGKFFPEGEIIATDIDPVCLERARRGVYPAGALRDVSQERLNSWFTPVGEDTYMVLPKLREGIFWQRHNILIDPPPGEDANLVFLRNSLLTYCRREVAVPALQRIVQSLAPGGFLVTGSEEALSEEASPDLRSYDRCIYQKAEETCLGGQSGRPGSRSGGIE
ncbi:MAG: CheR family methyltransferase [Desulfohalobiaceae bacterium]